MAQKMLIDATHAEETRVVVVDGNRVEEFDFETASRRQLAGNIYLAKVTRVEPSLQAAFVDYGGNRHGFLAFSEIHPDYYQIPAADREALLAEEQAMAREADEESARPKVRRSSSRRGSGRSKAERAHSDDAVETRDIAGMDIVEPEGDGDPRAEAAEAGAPTDDSGAPGNADTPGTEASADAGTAPGDTGGDDRAGAPDDAAGSDGADEGDGDNGDDDAETADDGPYVAADHAAETDDQIESVADDDVSDEVRPRRRARMRKYKIQEVIKVRQIMLVQVVKEERGNKGAALTTYLSLAGRYCVLMPNTARGGGISRKITNAADRKKLKDIAGTIEVPKGAGLIIRTAGAKRTKAEIKRDYEYLFRLWEQIRELTLKSIAPAPIYEEGDLIKRSIRDLYNREIDEVLVEGADGYRVAKDFMKMIMPSHARNVKQYADPLPLFARFQVESYLAGMFNPTVQLPSGGYIVIGVTEALVAIDVNSGKATREGSIEETALRTNLESAEEIARQLRLRDLAGLIVIDFIDMEERRNNAAVEKMLKDKLKSDRARIQVGRISGFGLLEMSRQRLRPGMLESTTQPCPHCHGTGLIRSNDSVALAILRQIEEEGTRRRTREVLVRAPVEIANFLINQKREHIAGIEARYGMAVRIEGDPAKVSPDFTLEKFRTATRVVEAAAPVVSVDTTPIEEDPLPEDAAPEDEADTDSAPEPAREAQGDDDSDGKRKRRRRRRRRGGGNSGDGDGATDAEAGSPAVAQPVGDDVAAPSDAPADAGGDKPDVAGADTPEAGDAGGSGRKPRKRGGRRGKAARDRDAEHGPAPDAPAQDTEPQAATAGDAAAEPGTGDAPEVDPGVTADAAPEVAAATVPSEPVAAAEPEVIADAPASADPAPDAPAPQDNVPPVEPAPAPKPETPVPAEGAAAPSAAPAEPAPAEPAPAEPAPDAGQDDTVTPQAPAPAMAAANGDVSSGSAGNGSAPDETASGQTRTPESSEPETPDESRPRRRGWWNLGR
ncbi:MAG: ribonuclease E/G [Rhodobacteraceae bacterium]|nr:ribonuclease E/G [Paracoccaceae bacterium]